VQNLSAICGKGKGYKEADHGGSLVLVPGHAIIRLQALAATIASSGLLKPPASVIML